MCLGIYNFNNITFTNNNKINKEVSYKYLRFSNETVTGLIFKVKGFLDMKASKTERIINSI